MSSSGSALTSGALTSGAPTSDSEDSQSEARCGSESIVDLLSDSDSETSLKTAAEATEDVKAPETTSDPDGFLASLRARMQQLRVRADNIRAQPLPSEFALPQYNAAVKMRKLQDIRAQTIKAALDAQLRRTRDAGAVATARKRNFPELPEPLLQRAAAAVHPDAGADPNDTLVSRFNINIRFHDMAKLAPGEWLNDELINFYGQLIMQRARDAPQLPRVHFFNTFFYSTLRDRGYSSVRTWGRRADVLSKDLVLIPVHLGAHWCCGVVDFRNSRVAYYDSLHGRNAEFLSAMRTYLEEEHQARRGEPLDTSSWRFESPTDIPRQHNGYDCGVFACMYAEYLSRDEPFSFSQADLDYFRQRMACEILSCDLLVPI